MYVTYEEGKKASMARYYKDRIYDSDTRKIVSTTQGQKQQDKFDKFITGLSDKDRQMYNEAVKAAFDRMQFKNNQKDNL